MKILFDFEEYATQAQLNELFDGESGIIFNELKRFYIEMLRVIEDEINTYPNGKIIISSNSPFEPKFYGFDDKIKSRLLGCLTQNEHDYISKKIWRRLYGDKAFPNNNDESPQ